MKKALLFCCMLLFTTVCFTQVVYTFNGKGNWTDPANWLNQVIPPATLAAGSTIHINPNAGDTCILNTSQTIAAGASLVVDAGAIFLIPGGLTIGSTAVTDYDGNVYNTVTIGTQTWMTENLKTTHFNNGDPVPQVTDQAAWGNLSTAGYCNLENDVNNAAIYGRLYNWYAVNDNRKLAPAGWHVATDEEWTTLATYLGGELVAGGKMKETGTAHWCDPNIGATNESSFSALPGGGRTDIIFTSGCEWGLWWSATESDATTSYNRIIFDSGTEINRVNNDKRFGMSVRCVKD
jgi:uncharacterized protein (TIGR02145 family)